MSFSVLMTTKEVGEYYEMRAVLEWASENVEVIYGPSETRTDDWKAYPKGYYSSDHAFTAPTLYQALHKAWSERGEKL